MLNNQLLRYYRGHTVPCYAMHHSIILEHVQYQYFPVHVSTYDILVLQDDQIYLNDFEKSVTGTAHLLPAAPRRRTLFIPEVLVEKVPKVSLDLSPEELAAQRKAYEQAEKSKTPGRAPISENSLNLSPDELTAQRKAFEKAERDKISTDDKASINALVVADQSINITEQQEAYKKLQAKSRNNVEDEQSHGRSPASQGHEGCEDFSNVQDDRMQRQASKHTYEDVEGINPSSQHQELHKREQVPGVDKHREVNQRQNEVRDLPLVHHTRNKPEPPYEQENESRNGSQTEPAWNQQRQQQEREQYSDEYYNNQWSSDPSARPHPGVTYPSDVRADATSVGEGPVDHNLGKGSVIQIPAPDPSHPMRYGTIKWTGLLPHAVGEIAGIELVKLIIWAV